MHELSLAQGLIEIVLEECRKSGNERVEAVNVRIGRASGIMPDALLFAFEAIKAGSVAQDAVLNIEEVPVSGLCRECGASFVVEEDYVLSCPVCEGSSFSVTTGREMDIVDIEVS